MELFGLVVWLITLSIRWPFWLIVSIISTYSAIHYNSSIIWWVTIVTLLLTIVTLFVPKKWKKIISLPDTL